MKINPRIFTILYDTIFVTTLYNAVEGFNWVLCIAPATANIKKTDIAILKKLQKLQMSEKKTDVYSMFPHLNGKTKVILWNINVKYGAVSDRI